MRNEAVEAFESGPAPAQPVRVLLDARKLRDGGIGTYIENLVHGLLAQPGIELTLLARPETVEAYEWSGEVGVVEERARPYSPDELFRLARRIDFSRFDLFHEPHWTAPFGVPVPTVVTVHDLIHVNHPERFYYPAVARPWIRSALRRAARIVAVSRATAREIGALVGNDRRIMSKISVVPNAIDPYLFRSARGSENAVPQPYLLSVCSTAKPHKGIPELLEAFSRLRRSHSSEQVLLVLAGSGARRELWANRLDPGLREGVIFRGHVSRETLAGLYAGARALVVASRAEGFALPVIEAQACGTLVVTTPVPAIGEIVTPLDVVCRDFTPEALAAGMAAALRSAAPRDVPREHFERFDRDRVAESIAALYRSVSSERGAR